MSWPRSVYWGGVQAAVMQEEEAGQDSTSRQAGAMSVPEILLPPCELEEWEEEGGEMKIADLSPRRPPGTWRRRKVHRLSQIHKN